MQRRRILLLTSLLLVVSLVLAGCGPRAGGAQRSESAEASGMIVDLPAIYIDVGEDGAATIGGMSLGQASALIGRQLPDIALPASVIGAMEQANVQHIQLINTKEGLDILVNGLKVPSLAWDAATLKNLGGTLALLGISLGPAESVLPLLGTVNTGVVFRFPVAAGAAAVPLIDPAGAEASERMQTLAEQFAASVGETMPVLKFVVNYADDGTWQVEGDEAKALRDSIPWDWDQLNLKPESVQRAVKNGIRTLGVATQPDGIHIMVNDEQLPVITWGSGELLNILNLVKKTGLVGDVEGPVAGMLGLVEPLLPAAPVVDFSVTVNFPAE